MFSVDVTIAHRYGKVRSEAKLLPASWFVESPVTHDHEMIIGGV